MLGCCDVVLSSGSIVVKLAAGDGSGGLRRGFKTGEVASYVGEVLDSFRVRGLVDDTHIGGVDRCGEDYCAWRSRGRKRVLADGTSVFGDAGFRVEGLSGVRDGAVDSVGANEQLVGSGSKVCGGMVRSGDCDGVNVDGEVSGGIAGVGIGPAFVPGGWNTLGTSGPETGGTSVSDGFEVVLEPVGVKGTVRSKNARKKAGQRARRAAAKFAGSSGGSCSGVGASCSGVTVASDEVCGSSEGCSFRDVTSVEEQREFARSWFECKLAENRLSKQRAEYNFKRNVYFDSSRISEKRWESDRLRCEEKLANINRIRFGSKPGYAETLASLSDGSEKPPSLSTGSDSPASLSDGTISPNSSMSVAEECKLKKKLEEMSEEVAQLKLERAALTTSRACSGGKVVVEDGRIHVYDGTGQYVPPTPVYGSECALSMGDYPEELQRHCDFVY